MQQVKKIKFQGGRDANRALTRKLVGNLIRFGKVETTMPKAKTLKSVIDRLTNRAQVKNEAHKNILLKALSDRSLVEKLFSDIAPRFKDRKSGFVRVVKVGYRQGDGSLLARVEWVEGVVPRVSQTVEPVPTVNADMSQKEIGSETSETGKEVKRAKRAAKARVTKKVEK